MRMNASEVGNWLRRRAGKRDHRQLVPDDQVVLRPGPNFDWLMGNLAAGQPTLPEPEPGLASDERSEIGDRAE